MSRNINRIKLYNEMVERFKSEDINDEYEILTKPEEYINYENKLHLKHKICGNDIYISAGKFINSHRRCKFCKFTKQQSERSLGMEEFKKRLNECPDGNEYEILPDQVYINGKTAIKAIHTVCGNEVDIVPQYFIHNGKSRCKYCANKKENNINKNKFIKLLNNEYTLESDYINSRTYVTLKHNECGNTWKVKPNDFQQGHRCPNCSCKNTGVSVQETELLESIREFYSDEIIVKDRNTIYNENSMFPSELDFYFPKEKVAIEFDGLYWHSDRLKKDKNYHLNKTIKCEKQGIRLIHIFEDEWLSKKEIVISKLKNILNCNNNLIKIRASDCYIEELSSQTKNEFLDNNHIQGADKAGIRLGLWYHNKKDKDDDSNDILVSVMTFCKPRSSLGKSGKFDYELSRFANDIHYRVYGGFDKLFKYFEDNYEWSIIRTYADRRWSTMLNNNLYTSNKFNLIHISRPNYWYCTSNKRYHRYKYRKSELKKLFPKIYKPELTEFQIMDKTSMYRIYDCGNFVYEYKK